MKNKKLLTLIGSVCLTLVLAALLLPACAPAVEPGAAEIAALQKEVASLEKEIAKLEAAAPAPVEKFTWRMQSYKGAGSPEWDVLLPRFADRVGERSEGRLDVTVYPPGALVGTMEMFEATAAGTIEICINNSIYHAGFIPVGVIWALPFSLEKLDEFQYLFWELGWEDILREEYAKRGVHLIATGVAGQYGAAMSTVPINTVADYKGLKMRSYGVFAKMFEELEVSLVTMPAGEMYTALATGTIDAATWGGPEEFVMFKIYEVCPYYIQPPFIRYMEKELLVNPDNWNKLPYDLRVILELTVKEYLAELAIFYTHVDVAALPMMVKEHGVTVLTLPEDEVAKLKEVAYRVWDELAAADPTTAKAIDIMRDYMRYLGYLE